MLLFFFHLFSPNSDRCKSVAWTFLKGVILVGFLLGFFYLFSWLSIIVWSMDSTLPVSLFHWLFYRYIDGISLRFDSSHMEFPLLSISTNRFWAHYLGFCFHLLISFCLACPCVMWHWFASSHINFNPCMLRFYFFRFNFWMCCKYTLCVAIFFAWLTLGPYYNETILLHLNSFIIVCWLGSI